MSISHTPGPWQQADGDDMEIEAAVGAAICTVLTAVDFPCVEDVDAAAVERECEANARLIAAAPELLGLLVQSHKVLRGMRIYRGSAGGNCGQCGKLWNGEQEKHHDNCLIVKIDAAISKATSRQPEGER